MRVNKKLDDLTREVTDAEVVDVFCEQLSQETVRNGLDIADLALGQENGVVSSHDIFLVQSICECIACVN